MQGWLSGEARTDDGVAGRGGEGKEAWTAGYHYGSCENRLQLQIIVPMFDR